MAVGHNSTAYCLAYLSLMENSLMNFDSNGLLKSDLGKCSYILLHCFAPIPVAISLEPQILESQCCQVPRHRCPKIKVINFKIIFS